MDRDGLSKAFVEAGGERVTATVPDPLPIDLVRTWIRDAEAVLRLQYGDAFPEEWDRKLEEHDTSTNVGAIRRWAAVKRFQAEHAERQQRHENSEGAETAARQLLRREPVDVEIAGVTRQVYGRSYSAYQEMAQHQLVIDQLKDEIEHSRKVLAAISLVYKSLSVYRQIRRRKMKRAKEEVVNSIAEARSEILRHRERIYAHAFNPAPAPSEPTAPAPDFWIEADEADDARLVVALYVAGPGRYAKLGRAPEAKSETVKRMEDMGFASLFASIEKDRNLEPASLYDRDLFQHLTAARAGAVDFSRDD